MFGLNIAKQACKAPQIYIVIILNNNLMCMGT